MPRVGQIGRFGSTGKNAAAGNNPFVQKASGGGFLRRASPNSSFVQRASNLQLLGSLGSYVAAFDGSLVVDQTGAYVYSEA